MTEAQLPLHFFTGTSGYSYAEWKGVFYPKKMPSKDMLGYYATKLDTVEINNTFYRMPAPRVIESWASQVGEDFRFAVKAPRTITHFKKLMGAEEVLDTFLGTLTAFGTKLGPVLVQTPPTLKADKVLLGDFLALFGQLYPRHFPTARTERCAFEFRHPTWFNEDTYALLRDHRAALVGGDVDNVAKSPPVVNTGPWTYLRLRKTEYAHGELEGWAEQIHALGVDVAFVYFKHEVLGPALALQLKQLVGAAQQS
jgi:uncharacterized protein YecE (DUF72 family)